jgi:hypothetical protein
MLISNKQFLEDQAYGCFKTYPNKTANIFSFVMYIENPIIEVETKKLPVS